VIETDKSQVLIQVTRMIEQSYYLNMKTTLWMTFLTFEIVQPESGSSQW